MMPAFTAGDSAGQASITRCKSGSNVYSMYNNSLRFHDIETAEEVLGYRPLDDAGEELDPDAPPQVPYRALAHPE